MAHPSHESETGGAEAAFEAVCAAMENPSFYPHAVSRIERRDTHISAVFLTGGLVYKVKKPVSLGFLDFRRLEDRKTACEREVLLNRRLSRDVYREVVPIHRAADGAVSLDACGPAAEYAVRMRQLPDGASLKAMILSGAADLSHMDALGRRLAKFYGACHRSPETDGYGSPDAVAFNMEENFRQLAPWVGEAFDGERWEFLREANRTFLDHHGDIFRQRVRDGRIRDGHGDLRTDHVYFDDGLQIIDCIEFNDRFRYGDAAADIAFLVMDTASLGRPDLGHELLGAYAAAAGDPGVFALIDFYVVYRAVVRLKVACMQLSSAGAATLRGLREEIGRYMDVAFRHTLLFGRPTLWVCCGLPASGKSFVAGRLGEILGIGVFSSDTVRREMMPGAGVAPYGEGAYSPGKRGRIYARMLALAQNEVRSGRSVVLDATYAHRRWRDAVRGLATDMDANVVFCVCGCSSETRSRRMARRDREPGISDARIGHLADLAAEFDALDEVPADQVVHLDTEGPADQTVVALLRSGYSLRRLQVIQRLM